MSDVQYRVWGTHPASHYGGWIQRIRPICLGVRHILWGVLLHAENVHIRTGQTQTHGACVGIRVGGTMYSGADRTTHLM